MILFKVLADITVLVHLFWILFLIFGAFLGLYRRVFKIIHVSGLVFAIVIQIFGWYCPLTYLEIWLRYKHDPALSYSGSFIITYVEKLVYLQISRTSILIATVILIGMNILVYIRKK